MVDQEKVIKGLEHCVMFEDHECIDYRCPYYYKDCSGLGASLELLKDALALLKAQEPRVMTPEDFDDNPDVDSEGRLPAWREINRGDKPSLVADGYCTITKEEMKVWDPLFVRWWTSRPSDEVRRATPWTQTNGL